MQLSIDLNCDLGESFGPYTIGADEAVMPVITSANVACGFHGGDPGVMDRTVALAVRNGVAVGAHPGYPDLHGFGRRVIPMEKAELASAILYQIGALDAFCRKHGAKLRHVKPHGALYNIADTDEDAAAAILDATRAFDASLPLFVKSGTAIHALCARRKAPYLLELFPDRAYAEDGTLVPRRVPGAVIRDPEEAVKRGVRMIVEGKVTAITGRDIAIGGDTLCVHGDTPGAATIARLLRERLTEAGIAVARLCD